MRYEPKERWQKNILIMGKHSRTIELITELGINYIPCCKIVLMFYNYRITTPLHSINGNSINKLHL